MRNSQSPTPAAARRQVAEPWAGLLLILSFLAIVFFTLFPFNFTVPHGMTLREAAAPFDWRPYDPSDPMDTVNNIILFTPFGFALASLVLQRTGRLRWAPPVAALISCLLSCSIEFQQQWLPLRDSSLADICSNTAGGLLGALIFLAMGVRLLRGITDLLVITLPNLPLAILALMYLLLLACAIRGPLRMRHRYLDLASWDTTYPLAVGNDPKGDRPWEGTVTSIDIADEALPPAKVASAYAGDDLRSVLGAAVLAEYRIEPGHEAVDLTHQSPNLRWIDSAAPINGVANLSVDHWLQSTGAMSVASQGIRDTSRFTIRCRFQSAHPSQSPELRRIVAIAFNSLHCNLVIGQEQTDLVIRLRSILTGDNGTNPACKIPDFFLDPAPHDLILTYDDPTLRLYIDGPAHSKTTDVPADFGGVSRFLARAMTLPFDGFLPEMYRVAFYLINFAPLALMLPIIACHGKLRPKARTAALVIGFLAPTLAMQVVLIAVCHRAFRTDNLLIGLAMTSVVAFPMTKWLRCLYRAKVSG
jgi:glycopeptide antibiotics resistance protein